MILLGMAGMAGVGKDTVADYLVKQYGFVKFSFSDALYREAAAAFGLEDEALLRDRATKEVPTGRLALRHCTDDEFTKIAGALLMQKMFDAGELDAPIVRDPWYDALSPRQILQWWGTEYRRAQNPRYWIVQADRWVYEVMSSIRYPEHRPQLFVNSSVRFPNERDWVHTFPHGQVWHIRRKGLAPVAAHESEAPLDVWEHERELYNNDTVERLHRCGVEALLTTNAKFVKVESMLPASPLVGVGEQGVE